MVGRNRPNPFPKGFVSFFLLGAVAVGIFLRFYNITTPSVWIDELNHYYAAETLLENGKATLPSGEPNERAIIYSWLVAWTFDALGADAFSLRFPSAFLGVLCIILSYIIAKYFFGVSTALLAALFVAISPFEIGWSRLSRFYTLFQFLFMIAIAAFYRGFENDGQGLFSKWQKNVLTKLNLRSLQTFFDNWQLNIFWLAAALLFFLISLTVHQLTVLFYVGLLFYLGIAAVIQWRTEGIKNVIQGKYFILGMLLTVPAILVYFVSSDVRVFIQYAVEYAPKWADMPKFQSPWLHLKFLFHQNHFPAGMLFVIGAYQVAGRLHRGGIYLCSLFMAFIFMFMFVFSYRHLQYIFCVYAVFIIICAHALANIFEGEFDFIHKSWFSKTALRKKYVTAFVFCSFLAWLALTPSVHSARRIPFEPDGSFNGAMYMEEWLEACQYVKNTMQTNDVIISTDALGTLHYVGHVDYDLNFTDFDLARDNDLKNEQGDFFDLYSGKPFIKDTAHLEKILHANETVWFLGQHYKFFDAPVFVPLSIRKYVLDQFEHVLTTQNKTVEVFKYTSATRATVSLD